MKWHICSLFTVLILMALLQILSADEVNPSKDPPGGLKPEQVPQFVCIGFDDNIEPEGMRWVLDMLKDKKNPTGIGNAATFDGTPVRATFYCNTRNGTSISSLAAVFKEAYGSGHEIGNHTAKHTTNTSTTQATWVSEMNACKSDLKGVGIPENQMIGFRTPYLEYNDATFTALSELGFTYDCSIESGYDDDITDATNFYWPYTLHNGSIDDDIVKQHPGLWEMPAYLIIVPEQLRAQIKLKSPTFDDKTGKQTGLDYNLWGPASVSGLAMTKDEFVTTMRYCLDQRLNGNRSPFLYGVHSQYYTQAGFVTLFAANVTLDQLRAALVEFITYALSKKDVRIVSVRDLLAWMRNPVPLTGTGIDALQSRHSGSPKILKVEQQRISVLIPVDGECSLSIYSICGRRIYGSPEKYLHAGMRTLAWNCPLMPGGMYVVVFSIDGRDCMNTVAIVR